MSSFINLVEELKRIGLAEAEAFDLGIGLDPLLNEFVYNIPSLPDEAKIHRLRTIAEYYKKIYNQSGNVKLAYTETRKWAMQTFVKHHIDKRRKELGLTESEFSDYTKDVYTNIHKEYDSLKKQAQAVLDKSHLKGVKVVKVALSGSYARRTPTEDSDIDIKVYYTGRPVAGSNWDKDSIKSEVAMTLAGNIGGDWGAYDVHAQPLSESLNESIDEGRFTEVYHVAPESQRDSIRKYGLNPRKAPYDISTDGNRLYVFGNFDEARWYRAVQENQPADGVYEPFDIYSLQVSKEALKKDYGLSSGDIGDDSAYSIAPKNIISFKRLTESIDEKEQFFLDRTNKHRALVNKAIDKIVNTGLEWKEFDENELVARGKVHDQSKFEEPEKTPYIDLTWRKKNGQKDTTPEINQATLHHVLDNEHHPEYWNPSEANISKECRDESDKCIDATKMPPLAIAEMVSDWKAMSDELGTNSAREWFEKQRNVRWHFSLEQENLINRLLVALEKDEVKESEDLDKAAAEIQDLINVQANDPIVKDKIEGDYFRGLANGMIVAKACVDGEDPKFVNPDGSIDEAANGQYLYHVTFTKKVPIIKREGLRPLRTSNWVKAGDNRYGKGEIFAFEDASDAVRWAGRMDWEFNTDTGSGKISIIKIRNSGNWEEDTNDPLSHIGSRGRWVKKLEPVPPTDILSSVPVTSEMIKRLVQSRDDSGTSGDMSDILEARNRPLEYQDKNQEVVVHQEWNNASFRYDLEGAGDIFRELCNSYNDPGYVNEKVRRLEYLLERYAQGIHPDDSIETAWEVDKDKMDQMLALWIKQPTVTKEQELAKNLNIELIKGNIPEVRILLRQIKNLKFEDMKLRIKE